MAHQPTASLRGAADHHAGSWMAPMRPVQTPVALMERHDVAAERPREKSRDLLGPREDLASERSMCDERLTGASCLK